MVKFLIILFMMFLFSPCYAIDLDQDTNSVLDTQFGGPNVQPGTDPDVDALAEYGIDTDDFAIRGWDGTNQFVYGQKTKSIQFGLANPDDLSTHAGRSTQSVVVWYNDTGFTFNIDSIRAISDADNYDFNLFESNSDTDIGTVNDTLIDFIECDTNGTGGYYDIETTLTHSVIEPDHYVIFEHSAGTAINIHVTLTGYLDGNVD